MRDEKSFLKRWSRHKRGARQHMREKANAATADRGALSEVPAVASTTETQSTFDPASLPPIESIDAGSDIRAFLAAGVPSDLTRAALRRAWSADTTIRDFVGLSENAWDFNATDGVPGFGSVAPENVRRLLAQAMGEPEPADPAHAAGATTSVRRAPASTSGSSLPAEPTMQQTAGRDSIEKTQDATADRRDPASRRETNVAMQNDSEKQKSRGPLSKPSHGVALPE